MKIRVGVCMVLGVMGLFSAEIPTDIQALLKRVYAAEMTFQKEEKQFTEYPFSLGDFSMPKGVSITLAVIPPHGFEAEICDLRNGLFAYIDETGAIYGQTKRVPVVSGSFVDSRDGKVYPTLTFGTTTWMAANLAFASKDSWCYGDDESRGKQLGRLYTWVAAQQACPKGWHVATREEWYTLIRLAGGRSSCGMKLKSQSLWVGGVPGTEKGFAADAFGFGVLPAGQRSDLGGYHGLGEFSTFWTSTDNGTYGDWGVDIYFGVYGGMVNDVSNKARAFSVRCVKD